MTSADSDQPKASAGPAEAMATAEAHLQHLRQEALLAEAEDAAHGARWITIVTGDLETDGDAARLEQLSQAGWRDRPDAQTTRSVGGNDYIAFRVTGPGAERAVTELDEIAHRLNPGWWRITHQAP